VPGQLYAERLQFAFVLVSPESFARSDRQYRVQVERQVGVLPIQPGARYDPAAIIHRAEGDEGFRERLGKAASDYVATKLGDPAFAAAAERWITRDNYPETALIEVCHRISSGLGTIVEKPLGEIGTELRLPGPEAATAAGIGAALVLQPVTEPLGRLSTFLEITGVVVGVATGLHPLALASAKSLAHDRFHDFVARGFREAARQVFEGPAEPAESPEPARPVAEAPKVSAPTIGAPETIPPEAGNVPTAPTPTAPSPSTLWGPPSASRPNPVEPADPVRPEWPDDPAVEGPGFG
jgi:hypothetical protein